MGDVLQMTKNSPIRAASSSGLPSACEDLIAGLLDLAKEIDAAEVRFAMTPDQSSKLDVDLTHDE